MEHKNIFYNVIMNAMIKRTKKTLNARVSDFLYANFAKNHIIFNARDLFVKIIENLKILRNEIICSVRKSEDRPIHHDLTFPRYIV